jgi:hypothetical protein
MLCLAALFVAAPGQAQLLTSHPFERNVPVSLAEEEPWSWYGLPSGAGEARGVTYELPAASPGGELATASAVELAQPAAVVYAVVSPVVENHLASVRFGCRSGKTITIPAEECALVWAAEEPHTRRLLLARAEAEGDDLLVEVEPQGVYLFALTVGGPAAATDEKLRAAYAEGQKQWHERFLAEAPAVWRLRQIVEQIPEGRIAVLPPAGGEPAALSTILARTRLRQKLVTLTGDDLLDAQRFSADRYPVALYVGVERHLRTIREPNDAADAVIRYLAEGGAIVMATSMPYPTYYAIDAGEPQPIPNQPLLRRLGVDIVAAFERPPEGAQLTIRSVEGQTILPSVTESWPFPSTGDLRLRAFGVRQDEPSSMTPILEVRDAQGNAVGPCAALFDLAGPDHPAGTILYVWSGVMNDAQVAEDIVGDLVRWIADRLRVGQ